MKYLNHYIEEAQHKLFDEMGAFFAFSQKQFDESMKPGVRYMSLGMGMIVPVANAQALVDRMEQISKEGIAQDLSENGKEGVIKRELQNHEAYYTRDIRDTVSALQRYGITKAEVQAVYDKVAPTIDDY